MTQRTMRNIGLLGLLVVIGVAGWVAWTRGPASTTRQTEVRARGQSVMPFDLDQTQHTFTTTATGGVETVVARDPANQGQIALIQEHLAHEARQFAAGTFTDPAAIHGADMSGLAALSAGASAIRFDYVPLPTGGQITYTTSDQALITALHAWFGAQVTDHGHDATGHDGTHP
ncbi:MAG TPA: hypothetical protein VGE07_05880 [Herpetosiphonaceae bacterium]